MEMLLLFKSLHIVGFVAWFGGLFYLVRIFVYHREAFDKSDIDRSVLIPQYKIMEDRVYRIICNPGMMITWACGLIMLYIYGIEWLKVNYWMHAKLVLLVGLTGYHLYCKTIIKQLSNRVSRMDSFQYRLFNEVPTLFLLSIVLLAVFRNLLDFGIAFVGVLLFGVTLFVFARLYKKQRKQ
jgi:protoporphyrinogen IX oxidase